MKSNAIDEKRRASGQRRRERTRLRLLAAAAKVLAQYGEQKATIEDFVEAAGVSRGTFYNYYGTVEELLDDLWEYVGQDPFLAIQDACSSIESPAERFTAKARLILQLADQNKTWGWVLYFLSAGHPTVKGELLSYPAPDLKEGIDAGAFSFDNLESATDLAVGTLRSALHALISENREENYVLEICTMLLRAFGVDDAEISNLTSGHLPPLSIAPSLAALSLPKQVRDTSSA